MKKISEKRVYDARIFSVSDVELTGSKGTEIHHSVIRFVDTVSVLPVTKRGTFILEKQYRTPVDDFLLEIPAGKIDAGEEPEAAMLRELEEEICCRAVSWKRLFGGYVSCGYSDEFMHYFVAEVEEISEDERNHFPDGDEEIQTVEVTPAEAFDMVKNGKIVDTKTITMILAYMNESGRQLIF